MKFSEEHNYKVSGEWSGLPCDHWRLAFGLLYDQHDSLSAAQQKHSALFSAVTLPFEI